MDEAALKKVAMSRGYREEHGGKWTKGSETFLLDYPKGLMVSAQDWEKVVEDLTKPRTGELPLQTSAPVPAVPLGEVFEGFQRLADNDVVMVFGDTGTGKSCVALAVLEDTLAAGKKAVYYDTERNLTRAAVERLPRGAYTYNPRMKALFEATADPERMPKADLFVLDSIGFPGLVQYARMSLRQKGDALQQVIAVLGSLKEWCFIHGAVALVINQPTSEMGLEQGEEPRPWGHKGGFATKLILKSGFNKKDGTGGLKVWRGRDLPYGQTAATYTIREGRAEVRW